MPHISYSELKNWCRCPFYHKLVNVDKIKAFKGNEFTAFGTALHAVCEELLTESINLDGEELFIIKFREEINKLDTDTQEINKELIISMFKQGNKLVSKVLPAMSEYFGNYKVIQAEEKLYEPIEGFDDYLFKGYVDLIVQTDDGKYHIIDWKTAGWGWDIRRRSDKMVLYQLILYKYFFCKKHDISPQNVETHFALLKRTAKKDIIELFKVTSGIKRTQNALSLLHQALKTIQNKVCVKNKMACTSGYGCEFYKTEHCK